MNTPVDLDRLTSWYGPWSGVRVVVLGLGVTGFSVADTLCELGAKVMVCAKDADELRLSMLEVIGGSYVPEQEDGHIPAELSEFAPDVVVVSPGYRIDHPIVLWAQEASIPIWGDIDLAWRVRDKVHPAQWIVVTGTNGKTTTVQLTEAMLIAGGVRAIACGNIGRPVLDVIRAPEGFDVLVVELSSFQLHWSFLVEPFSAAVINIADDHLDWHGSRENYIADKAKIYHNTSEACVYNKADLVTMRMVEDAEVHEGARAIGFDLGAPGMSDIGIVNGVVCDRAYVEDRRHTALEITTLEDLAHLGLNTPHMVSNILAATALARSYGVTPEAIREALASFQPDSHRNEVILQHEDIAWVDDSKATNAHAADASLSSYSSVVWIVGGLLKGTQLDDLITKHSDRVRAAVIIGVERESVLASFQRHAPQVRLVEVIPTETSHVMVDAVQAASELAKSGDTVLLAPAAASMDQFIDYAERGRLFAQAVKQTYGGEADGDSASDAI
jgi:UDP-N-acetylmuramoylalanine--D-glutamate ligase